LTALGLLQVSRYQSSGSIQVSGLHEGDCVE